MLYMFSLELKSCCCHGEWDQATLDTAVIFSFVYEQANTHMKAVGRCYKVWKNSLEELINSPKVAHIDWQRD